MSHHAPCRRGHASTERHVTARRQYRCDSCGQPIPPGSEYVVATEFPGGEAEYADYAGHPVRFRIHSTQPCHYHPEGTT